MRFSGPSNKLNSASVGMVATKSSQDVKGQLMLFCTIYTNYNQKLLAGVQKPAIPWDKFIRLASRKGLEIAQEEKEAKNEVMVYMYFETRGPVVLLIMNSGIYL